MAKKVEYSFWIGLQKSFKNVLAVSVLPAIIFLVDNWTQWIPNEWNIWATPLFGFISYLIYNYFKIKE